MSFSGMFGLFLKLYIEVMTEAFNIWKEKNIRRSYANDNFTLKKLILPVNFLHLLK